MKLLDLLAKLGIVRFGAKKAVYTNAKDMPEEFLMDDVYNSERDLTKAEDVAEVKKALGGKSEKVD